MAQEVLTTVEPPLGALVRAQLGRIGIDVQAGTTVSRIDGPATASPVHTSDQQIDTDTVLTAAGLGRIPPWLQRQASTSVLLPILLLLAIILVIAAVRPQPQVAVEPGSRLSGVRRRTSLWRWGDRLTR